jgi:SNF2 family DNA or RNA helicase
MEVGTGKTKVSIEWIKWNKIKSKILVVTVNVPLAENWINEFKLNYPELNGAVLSGTAEERRFLLSLNMDFYVINYEGLRVIWDELYEKQWDVIILDESRRAKDIKSTRTKLCVELGKKTPYRAILSGLPTISPIDIFGQYLFLDRGETFGKNFYKFRRNFFKEIKKGRFSDWRLIKEKEEELIELIDKKCIRFLKSECLTLPDKLYKKLYVQMSPEQLSDYKSLVEGDGNLSLTKLTHQQIENCFIKYSQITGGFIKTGENEYKYYKENPKLAILIDLIQDAINDTKVIVFHRFIAEGRLIEEALNKHKIKFASMRSEIKHTEIEAKKFQEDNKIRVLVAHPLSGGIGLNFTQSSITIYYSLDWNLEYKLQADGRTYRIGQTKNVEYIHLLVKNTIDEEIWRSHQENISLIERMGRYKLSIKDVLLGKGHTYKEEF